MTSRQVRTLPIALLALIVGLAAYAIVPPSTEKLLLLPAVMAFAGAGTVVAVRRPDLQSGWLLLVTGLSWVSVGALDTYLHSGATIAATAAAWLLNWVWVLAFLALGLFFITFPDGPPAGHWRLAIRALWAGSILIVAARMFAPGPLAEVATVHNPVGVPGAATAASIAQAIGNALIVVATFAALAALIRRFPGATAAQRQQLLWMAMGGTVCVAMMSATSLVAAAGVDGIDTGDAYLASFAAVPVAAAIAIVRHRLFDIEIIVGRTVVVGGVLAFITAAYLAVVIGLGALVGAGSGANVYLAVTATALVAIGLQPLHARLRRLASAVALPAASAAEQEADVAIRTLGSFRLSRHGEPVAATAWQSKKARTLLKILVARRGRPTTRDQLVEILWPDEDTDAVYRRLSVAMATARAVLDPDKRHPADHYMAADESALRLDLSNTWVDVEQFLRTAATGLVAWRAGRATEAKVALHAAEEAYTGDFLEAEAYEDWAVALREEALAEYRAVVAVLAQLAAAAGDHGAAIRYHLRLLAKDPYDEPAHLGLVYALERDGRLGEARRHYHRYTAAMAEIRVPAAPFPAARNRTPTAP